MKMFENIPDVRVGGSVLDPNAGFKDFDIFCEQKDFAEVLYRCKGTSCHPIMVKDIKDLHNRLTFWNHYVIHPDGTIYRGEQHTESNELKFNERSTFWWDEMSHMKTLKKLLDRGHTIDKYQRDRFSYCVNKFQLLSMFDHRIVNLLRAKPGTTAIAGGFFRDFVQGKPSKDVDVFICDVDHYNWVCEELYKLNGVEIEFIKSPKVNVRKFKIENIVYDIINYGFVKRGQHVVDTFDFTINMLWYDPDDKMHHGPNLYGGFEGALEDICERRLVVGDNLWFKASTGRALRRWERFKNDGFVPDEAAVSKYKRYVEILQNGRVKHAK
jgi:hypothetical protein